LAGCSNQPSISRIQHWLISVRLSTEERKSKSNAHQGVEDDDVNLLCLGGRVVGFALAREIIQTFLAAHHVSAESFERRLAKVAAIECKEKIK
jgi:ribose 5-phosphate isomerase RpiB